MMTRNRVLDLDRQIVDQGARSTIEPYQRAGDVPAQDGSLFRRSPWAGVTLVLGLTFMGFTFCSWIVDRAFRLAEAAVESSQAVAHAAVEASVVTRQAAADVQGYGFVSFLLVAGVVLVFFGIGKLK